MTTLAPKTPRTLKAKSPKTVEEPKVEAPLEVSTESAKTEVNDSEETSSEPEKVGMEPVPFTDVLKELVGTFTVLKSQIKIFESQIKSLKVSYKEELKAKKNRKRNRKTQDGKERVSHGFIKPTLISNDLADFLGIEKGSLVTRPQVTKQIAEYIKTNECYRKPSAEGEKVNKTIIVPDKKLKKILGEPKFQLSKKNPELGLGYNYLNLQSYLKEKNHFIKTEPVVASA